MNTPTKVPAVVLAGGKTKPDIQAKGWPAWRALAPVCGRPIVGYVLDALRTAETVGEVSVVGPADLRGAIGDATLLPVGEAMWDNISTALRHSPPGPVLLASADAPLITAEAVDDTVRRGLALGVDFVYPIIRKEDSLSQCPGLSRTYATLIEGVFTGGNLMLVNGPAILAQDALIRKAIDARKKPLELARLISLAVVVKLLVKRARIAELEDQVTRVLHARARALITPYAEIGADLDTPDETPLVEAILNSRAAR